MPYSNAFVGDNCVEADENAVSPWLLIQEKLKHPWIVSYDCVPDILEIYSERRSIVYGLQYNAATAYKGIEAIFVADQLTIPASSKVPCIDAALKKLGC